MNVDTISLWFNNLNVFKIRNENNSPFVNIFLHELHGELSQMSQSNYLYSVILSVNLQPMILYLKNGLLMKEGTEEDIE